jgi:hypothetical protein
MDRRSHISRGGRLLGKNQEEIQMLKSVAVSLLVVVAVAVLATGCGASKSGSASSGAAGPSAAVATPADVNGVWTGALVGGAPVSMTLQQAGAKVTGDLRVGGRADISGPIEGTVDGNTIKLRERSGFGTAPLLNVKGDQISGIVGGTTLDLRRSR